MSTHPATLTLSPPGPSQTLPPRRSISPPFRNGSGPVSRRRAATPPSRTGWSLRPAFAVALVILLVLASAGGGWWLANRDDEPHRLLAPEVATPSADASPDVPMYRGNPARTGDMPGPGLDGEPVELWRIQVDGEIHSAPAVINGTLYFGDGNGDVYALDAETADVIWQFETGNPISSSPAVADGVVYVGSEDGTLYALDAASGTKQWTFPGTRPNDSVAVVNGIVYSGSEDGYLYAIDAATGDERWRGALGDAASRSPAVADGVVYIGSADGVLHAFDGATGEPGWTFQTEGGGVLATPTIFNGIAYQPTFDAFENYVYAIDTVSGEQIWRFEQASNPGFLVGGTNGNLFFTPSVDSHVYALDAVTGEEVWRFKTGRLANAGPAIVDDTLYFAGNDGFLYAVNASTGAELWRFAIDGSVDYGPVVIDGVAYLGTSSGSLYAIGGGNQFPGVTSSTPASTPGTSTAVASPAIAAPASPVASDGFATLMWESSNDVANLSQPGNVTIAPDGTIWVANGDGSTFEIFAPDGTHLETWGVPGVKEGEFNFIRANGDAFGAVAFAPDGSFYVADTGNRRIQHFSADRVFLNTWGGFGGEGGQFVSPIDIAVDSHGNVFVDDDNRDDVQKFAADGTWLLTFGGTGSEPGQLDFQGFLAIAADDTIWVADPDNQRIQQWDNDGTFLQAIVTSDWVGAPIDIAFDSEGRIFIADVGNPQVVILSPDGSTMLGSWGVPGDGTGQFMVPNSVRIDQDGNVYVLDLLRARLMKFTLDLSQLAEPGATPVATPVN